MKSIEKVQSSSLDEEWVSLMIAAKNIGFSPEEVREFIRKRDSSRLNNPHIHSQLEFGKRYCQNI
ncbi:anti-repressor SinI family protein [Lederbergia lenta]|uniref:Anti-repressor SinI n=1 Tax=Lederbergia lenta TaxID=1467 RepID=A0A2X4YQ17_LEDLE|nr:anti-repressor SinI family protein [Lederbergia lenta]MCM3110829.1 anti-repressor SinI family protein [Lederbergia lenta]MEC2325776.1 anti-repressor SinI family protein [Lederbergia lenta]SQI53765.1 Anti-repressor SinI [Lederbergia lenta]